jgi:hypothetical protein
MNCVSERDCPRPDDRQVHNHFAVERQVFKARPRLKHTVKERSDQARFAIEQLFCDYAYSPAIVASVQISESMCSASQLYSPATLKTAAYVQNSSGGLRSTASM